MISTPATTDAGALADYADEIVREGLHPVLSTNQWRMISAALRTTALQETWGNEPVAPTLDERQAVVIAWGVMAFGADHMADPIVRAARFIEEAAELVQAAGLTREHALRAFDHVYSRPAGELKQEVGGSANTLMALCGALGLSLDECQQAEIERCLAKDPAHFAARNQAKIRKIDTAAPQQSPRLEREKIKIRCTRCETIILHCKMIKPAEINQFSRRKIEASRTKRSPVSRPSRGAVE